MAAHVKNSHHPLYPHASDGVMQVFFFTATLPAQQAKQSFYPPIPHHRTAFAGEGKGYRRGGRGPVLAGLQVIYTAPYMGSREPCLPIIHMHAAYPNSNLTRQPARARFATRPSPPPCLQISKLTTSAPTWPFLYAHSHRDLLVPWLLELSHSESRREGTSQGSHSVKNK
jgi:hypothetical protein